MQYENGLINPALSASSISLDRRSNTSLNAIGNNMYDEAGPNSTYNTLQRNANNTVNPKQRRGRDVVYDNVGPATQPRNRNDTRTSNSQTSHKHARQRRRRNSIIRVVLMFLIVFVAAIALLLAILLMMGKIGPACSCESSGTYPFTIMSYGCLSFEI